MGLVMVDVTQDCAGPTRAGAEAVAEEGEIKSPSFFSFFTLAGVAIGFSAIAVSGNTF